jgi:HSP20 family molecular chaperone IbpA
MQPFFRLLENDSFMPSSSSLFRSPIFNNNLNSFTPSFDVKETKDSYVLDGELPGLTDKSNLDLQFVDPQTLVIKGRIERSSNNGNEAQASEGEVAATPTSEIPETRSHQPTVEDETPSTSTTAPAEKSEQAVTKTLNNQTVSQPLNNGDKFWVQERMVGEFQRSFSFPQNIDQDAVKASLKNGILSIVIPKRNVAEGGRRIQIE